MLNTFDLGSQIVGLLLWLLLAFVASSFISLLLALIEKYRARALNPMTAFVALIIAFAILGILDIVSLPDFFGSVEMPSPSDVLIWVSIWRLLTLGAFFLARRAPREDTRERGGALMGFWKFIVLLMFVFQSGILVMNVFPNADAASINIHEQESREAAWGDETIVIDATDIPSDSDTELSIDGIGDDEYGNPCIYDVERASDEEPFTLSLDSSDALSHFGGKQIKIKVHYPRHTVDGYDIAASMNQRLEAWIDGTTLRVKYSYDKPKKAEVFPGWNFFVHSVFFSSSGYVDISVVDDAESKS
jgi:hypothetical protein